MSAAAETSPDEVVRELFRALDALDPARIEARFTDDVQGVDELSAGWRRGRTAVHEYLLSVVGAGISDLRSELSDLCSIEWDDTAVVTFVLDQSYRMDGAGQRIHAPTSIVLRRTDGEWRCALLHSVPVAEPEE
jgi:ketosteroid isomerase-like protein